MEMPERPKERLIIPDWKLYNDLRSDERRDVIHRLIMHDWQYDIVSMVWSSPWADQSLKLLEAVNPCVKHD